MGFLRVMRWVLPLLVVIGGFVWFIFVVAVFDGSDRYGSVPIPGHKVIHLPAGKVDVAFRDHTVGSNDSLLVPPVTVSIVRANHDGADPGFKRASGSVKIVNSTGHQKVAELDVPADADYDVTTQAAQGFSPALIFGRGRSVTSILIGTPLAAFASWLLLTLAIRMGTSGQVAQAKPVWTPPAYVPPAPSPVTPSPVTPAYAPPAGWQPPPPATQDPYDRLERLGQLHREGVITDDEFEDQKRKILGA